MWLRATISILLLLIVRLSSVLTDVVFDPEPYAVFTNTVKLIKTSNEKYYVPLGRNYVFRCHAMYWIAGEKLSPVEEENPFMWTYVNPQREDSHRSDSGKALYLFAVQYMHEGHYDCHIADVDGNEFVSRITLIVQECGIWTGEEDFDERRNPCQYGACVTEPYPEVPFLHLVKCKCVTQYTGEFCDVLVEGAHFRDFIHFSPFIGHMLAFLFVFIFYFCCRHGGSKPKISLIDEVPDVPRTIDDPKMLYPAALLPEVEEEQERDERLDASAVTKLLEELQKS